jgi:hypothetical protein
MLAVCAEVDRAKRRRLAVFIVMVMPDCIGFVSDPCAARLHRRFQIVSVHSIDAFLAMPGH